MKTFWPTHFFPPGVYHIILGVITNLTMTDLLVLTDALIYLYIFFFKILRDAGVLPGYDMTPEAALTKLSYVVGLKIGLEAKRKVSWV